MDNSQRALETILRVPDRLWHTLKSVLDEHDPPSPVGRKRIAARAALDAIILRLRSGVNGINRPTSFLTIVRCIEPFNAGNRLVSNTWMALEV